MAFVAAILAGLMTPTVLPQPGAFAASPAPSPTLGGDTNACDPAAGPALHARFLGIGYVQLFNGVYHLDRLDLTRPDSIAARFTRGYTSADTRSNHMGIGWTSNYDVRLRAFTSTDLVFTDPFGFTSKFLNAYASRTTDVMKRMTLSPPSPDWVATDGTTTWTLGDPSGNLLRVETAGGATIDIHYDGDRPTDTIGPDGTGLHFELDAKGRFVRVTDRQDKRRWIRFAYDTSGRLSQVDQPSGTTERYAYIGETQQIQTISNGVDEPLLRIDYDERGRAVKEQDAQGLVDGEAVDYEYADLLDGGVQTTVTYPESRLDPSWHPIQTTVHDSKGNLIELVVQPTRTERFAGRYDYDAANRRVVMQSACDLAPTADTPPIPRPTAPAMPLAAVLALFAQVVQQILAMF
jgi:YD repeat-containing protein